VGWIALQIAWSGGGESDEASQQGALTELGRQPVGVVILWLTVVGLFAMTVWQIAEAAWGHRDRPEGAKRIWKRLSSVGRAVAYAAIAVAAITALRGSSRSVRPHPRRLRRCDHRGDRNPAGDPRSAAQVRQRPGRGRPRLGAPGGPDRL